MYLSLCLSMSGFAYGYVIPVFLSPYFSDTLDANDAHPIHLILDTSTNALLSGGVLRFAPLRARAQKPLAAELRVGRSDRASTGRHRSYDFWRRRYAARSVPVHLRHRLLPLTPPVRA